MPRINYLDREINYEVYGSKSRLKGKPTIVGLANEFRTVEDGFGEFYQEFGPDVDVVLLENTNMGASTRLDRHLSPEEIVDEVEYCCNALKIEFPLFVGYCGNIELGFTCSRRIEKSGVILFSPLMRTEDGHFVEFLFSLFKRAILAGDAQRQIDALMIVDPHSLEHRANRMFPLVERHGAQLALKDAEFFWLQTLQNKPNGNWQWKDLPDFNRPVLMIKGNDDTIQIPSLMKSSFVKPHHKISVIESSHRILDNQPDDVRALLTEFVDFCAEWSKESEVA